MFFGFIRVFSSDMIGDVQCFPLGNATTPTKNGQSKLCLITLTLRPNPWIASARAFCYKMKVIEAFSIAIFVLRECDSSFCLMRGLNLATVALYIILVISLTTRAVALGYRLAWIDHINNLPWFSEYNTGYAQPMYYPPGAIQQQPGQSLVIQPGHHGQPTTVTTVPMH